MKTFNARFGAWPLLLALLGSPFATILPAQTNVVIPMSEALDAPALVWITTGSVPWIGENVLTHDGIDAAQSGTISNGTSSAVQTTVVGPGSVTFWWKVSSETNNDSLRFFINGTVQAAISGEVNWQQRTVSVPAGSQTLNWTYSKNASVAAGQDHGWVDQVQFVPAGCTISISHNSATHSSNSETSQVNVIAAAGCTWGLVNTNPWITHVVGVGDSNGFVRYILTANTSSSSRTGILSIGGNVFTITQQGTPVPPSCTFALSATTATHHAGTSTGLVSVTTAAGCSWSVANTNSWLSILAGANGTNNGLVRYFVTANPSFTRTGYLLIAGQWFAITQLGSTSAPPCTFAISPSSGTHSSATSTGLVSVSTVAGCSWTVANTNAWVAIVSGASGSSNGLVRYLLTENFGASRSGNLLVAGQLFTITQLAPPISLAAPTFTNVTATVAPGLPGLEYSSVAWGDYDNDGRPDFLITGTYPGTNQYISQLWRNTGSGFTNVTATAAPGLPGVFAGSVAWGDYDNDGHVDFIIAGETTNGIISQVWRNTGSGFTNATVGVAPGLPGVAFGAVAWGDYNNDGRLDFLITGYPAYGYNPNDPNLRQILISQLWRNTGGGFTNVTASVAPGLPGFMYSAVAWGDYDNDGRLDFLISGADDHYCYDCDSPEGQAQLWHNTGAGFVKVMTTAAYSLRSSVAWGDYDNDGRLDYLLGGELWRNTGNGFINVTAEVGLPASYYNQATWGDYDNDGRPDLLLRGSWSPVSQIWRNAGNRFTNVTETVAPGLSGVWGGGVAWGDYDNDGRLDFLITGSLYGYCEECGEHEAVSQLWRNNTTNPPPTHCAAAPTGLVAWWRGNANASDSFGDHDGTTSTGVSFGAGHAGQGFVFGSGNGGVRIPAASALDVGAGAGLSLELWINPAIVDGNVPLVEWNNGSWWGTHFFIVEGHLYANLVETSGGWRQLFSSGNVVPNQWQHVCLTYEKTTGRARMYLNGDVVADEEIGAFTPDTRPDLYLGRRPAGDIVVSYQGLMDEISLYDRALTALEIQAIHAAGSAGKCPTNLPPAVDICPGASLSPSSMSLGYIGGRGYSFHAVLPCPWVVINTNSWITITSPGSGTAGESTVIFDVAANTGSQPRSGKITIGGRYFFLSQASGNGGASCYIYMSPGSSYRGYGAMMGTVNVSTGTNCAWEVVNTNSWITILSGGGIGNGQVVYELEGNPGMQSRSGSFMIGNRIHNITQAGHSQVSLPADQVVALGGSATFSVTVTNITPPFTYQWQFNGADLVDGVGISGATTANLTLTGVQYPQGGHYRCVVSKSSQTFTSSSATLTVAPTSNALPLAEALDTDDRFFWKTWSDSIGIWFGQTNTTHDGVDALECSGLSQGEFASVAAKSGGPGILNFWWRTSLATPSDRLRFWIGSWQAATLTNTTDWEQRTFTVPPGDVDLQWTLSNSAGEQSKAWLDQVQFTPCDFRLPGAGSFVPTATGGAITVTAAADCPWHVVNTNSWITILSSVTNHGSGLVIYAVAPNPTPANRVGYLTIADQSYFLAQGGNSPNPAISLPEALDTESSLDWSTIGTPEWFGQNIFSRDGADAAQSGPVGDSGAVTATTTVNGPGTVLFWWRVSSETNKDYLKFFINGVQQTRISGEVDWQLLTYNLFSGSNTLKWTYSKNASVAVGQDRGWLDQVQFVPTPETGFCGVAISPISATHSANSDTGFVDVVVAAGCGWNVVNTNSWISFPSEASGTGNRTVTYVVEANPTASARSGTVNLAGQNFVVTQAGTAPWTGPSAVFDVGRDFSTIHNPNGVWTFGWAGTVTGSVYPLTVRRDSPADNGAYTPSWQLTYDTAPVVYCNISDQVVSVGDGQATLAPREVLFDGGQDGSPENFVVIRFTAPSNGLYTVATVVRPFYNGSPQGDADFHVVKNDTELFAQFLNPYQSAAYSNTLALNAGDTIKFLLGRGADGQEHGSIYRIVALINPRTGTNSNNTTNPPVCTYAISSNNASHPSTNSTGVVSVIAPTDCGWSVLNTNSWISIASGSNGTGNGTVIYSVAANPTASVRSGNVRIADKVFLITQSGTNPPSGCTISILPGSRTHGYSGASNTVMVTTQSGCPWNVVTANSWINILSSSNNSSGGMVFYSLAANTNRQARSGKIIIGGRDFLLTQPGSPSLQFIGRTQTNATFSVQGDGAKMYVVECSEDLIHWTPISTNSAPSTITDGAGGSAPRRFYRTVEIP